MGMRANPELYDESFGIEKGTCSACSTEASVQTVSDDYERYLERMSCDGTRGDKRTLQSIANVFQLHITIFTMDASCPEIQVLPRGSSGDATKPTHVLITFRVVKTHYNTAHVL